MRLHRLLPATACLLVAACAGAAPPAQSPAPSASVATVSPSAAASASAQASSPARAVVLRSVPPNLGCDAVPAGYTSATFRIDPAATEAVTAQTDTGKTLMTYWSVGFTGPLADDPVIRDPAGKAVAKDGDVLTIPGGAWPRLQGYFVCPSRDALYVLLKDPS